MNNIIIRLFIMCLNVFFLQGIHELDPTHRRTASHAYHSAE